MALFGKLAPSGNIARKTLNKYLTYVKQHVQRLTATTMMLNNKPSVLQVGLCKPALPHTLHPHTTNSRYLPTVAGMIRDPAKSQSSIQQLRKPNTTKKKIHVYTVKSIMRELEVGK